MSAAAALAAPGALLHRVRAEVTRKRVLLGIFLLINTRTFVFFPGVRPVEEMWLVVCVVSLALLLPVFKASNDWRFSPFEVYLIAMLAVRLLMPAISAWMTFGQPVLYGMLARRSAVLVAMWVLFFNAWRRRWVTAEDVEKVVVALSWGVLFLFVGMRLFLNPAKFDTVNGFVINAGVETAAFTVPGFVLHFGVMFYAVRALRERKLRYYIYAIVMAVVAAGASWRVLETSFLLTFFCFVFFIRRFDEAVTALVRVLLVAAAIAFAAVLVAPAAVEDAVSRYGQAVLVATGQGISQDASANARYYETQLALPYIFAHPLTGVGQISDQWRGGAAAILGRVLFEGDIGLIGVLSAYGILGLLLGALQFVLAWAAELKLPKSYHTPLLDGIKGFLLFSVIYSAGTGFFMFNFETTVFYCMLLVLLVEDYRLGRAALPAA